MPAAPRSRLPRLRPISASPMPAGPFAMWVPAGPPATPLPAGLGVVPPPSLLDDVVQLARECALFIRRLVTIAVPLAFVCILLGGFAYKLYAFVEIERYPATNNAAYFQSRAFLSRGYGWFSRLRHTHLGILRDDPKAAPYYMFELSLRHFEAGMRLTSCVAATLLLGLLLGYLAYFVFYSCVALRAVIAEVRQLD